MAWVRLHDGAMSHPKIVAMIDWKNPFCLWVWGLSYSQQHLTDGFIPRAALPNPQAVKSSAVLVSRGLWDMRAEGFTVHDYLDWNDSRAVVVEKRTAAKERMANARKRTTKEVRENFYVDRGVGNVSSSLSERESEGKPVALDAAALVFDAYQRQWSQMYGHQSSVIAKPLDYMTLAQHVATHPTDKILASLEAFFASTDEYVRRAKHPWPLFLRDPLKYLARPVGAELGRSNTRLASAVASIKVAEGA